MALILRNTKGAPLTWTEMDDNLSYLEQEATALPDNNGTNYVVVKGTGTPTENGTELEEAYVTAKTMSPDSDNIISLLVHPGYYEVATQFVMDTPYINLISLTSNRDINLTITGGGSPILIDTDYTHVRGIHTNIDTGGSFEISNDLPNIVIENCKGSWYSFGVYNIIKVSGTFIDCEATGNSFGFNGEASGTFIRCSSIGGSGSFGHNGGASGTFIDCVAEGTSFGSDDSFGGVGIASGTFIRCSAGFGGGSFGRDEASGIFIDCESQSDNSFGGPGGISSGEFTNCTAGDNSFGGPGGISSGEFTNCTAGTDSFAGAGGGGISSGVYNNCIAGDRSFGGPGGSTTSGVYTNCIGGNTSFGNDSVGSTLTGQLYYCRLTAGTFGSVTGAGRIYYCVDGNGDVVGGDNIIEKTYLELTTMISNSELESGQLYLMTDFQTIYDQPDYSDADTPKTTVVTKTEVVNPIILLAISTTEFAKEVWRPSTPRHTLEYDINFSQTEVMGVSAKGRITYCKDEFDNETHYDHTVVLLIRYESVNGSGIFNSFWDTGFGSTEVLTFGTGSLSNKIGDNYLEGGFVIGNNVLGASSVGNSIGIRSYNNTFRNNTPNNTFGNDTYNNTFGNNTYYNTFGNWTTDNNFGDNTRFNTFVGNTYNNTFGDWTTNNAFGDQTYYNIFGNRTSDNIFGNGTNDNIFGDYTRRNTFGNWTYENTFGNYTQNNTFGNIVTQGIDFTITPTPTHVYGDYHCNIFKRQDGTVRLSYYDNTDDLVVVNPTD